MTEKAFEFAGTVLRRDRITHFQFKTARDKTVSIIIKWSAGLNKGTAEERGLEYKTARKRYNEIRRIVGDL